MLSYIDMSGLCRFKHVFGKEREGVHAWRVFDVAVVDLVATLAIGVAISAWTGWNVVVVCVTLLALGIVAHRAFCVNTKINVALFGVV